MDQTAAQQTLLPVLSTLVTLITGSFVFFIYSKQKQDYKRDSAKAILSEITTTERIIKEVKVIRHTHNLSEIDTNKYILGVSTWSKDKYLFINDFDANEWERINTFFNQKDAFNKTILDIGNLLPKNIEYRTQYIQAELAKLAIKQAKEIASIPVEERSEKYPEIFKKYEDRANAFTTIYIEANTSFKYIYSPKAIFQFVENKLDDIDVDLSISSVGIKLNKAGTKKFTLKV